MVSLLVESLFLQLLESVLLRSTLRLKRFWLMWQTRGKRMWIKRFGLLGLRMKRFGEKCRVGSEANTYIG